MELNLDVKCIRQYISLFLLISNVTYFFNVFIYLFIYFTSLHVSSNPVLIVRRINCISTSSGMYYSV